MRTCERCKEPLVDDKAGRSADGRLICTRSDCQLVEEINARVKDGRFELADSEPYRVEITYPASGLRRLPRKAP